MSIYHNIKELNNNILRNDDIVQFSIDNIVCTYKVNKDAMWYYLGEHLNSSLVKQFEIISAQNFVKRRFGYCNLNITEYLDTNSLEDLTKIVIELFEICEKNTKHENI